MLNNNDETNKDALMLFTYYVTERCALKFSQKTQRDTRAWPKLEFEEPRTIVLSRQLFPSPLQINNRL